MSLATFRTYEPPTILNIEDMPQSFHSLNRSHTKMMFTAKAFFLRYPEDHVVLVTLTLPTQIISTKTASKMLNTLLKRFKRRWPCFLWVRERSNNRAIHYHVLLPTAFDAKQGVNLEKFETVRKEDRERKRKMVNPETLKLWNEIEAMAQKVGFGRCEVAPIYKSSGAVINYLGKTVREAWDVGFWKEDKHFRWWSVSRNLRCCTNQFCRNSPYLRQRYASFAEALGCSDLDDLLRVCGTKYAYLARAWDMAGRPAITRSNRKRYTRHSRPLGPMKEWGSIPPRAESQDEAIEQGGGTHRNPFHPEH